MHHIFNNNYYNYKNLLNIVHAHALFFFGDVLLPGLLGLLAMLACPGQAGRGCSGHAGRGGSTAGGGCGGIAAGGVGERGASADGSGAAGLLVMG